MISSFHVIQTCGSILGNSVGWVAKQYFYFHALEGVRSSLDTTISNIASRYFGNFFGHVIGNQLSYPVSIHYTLFLGDLVWTFVSETIQSMILMAARSCHIVDRSFKEIPLWIDLALRVSTAVVIYFGKAFFIHKMMPVVKIGIEKLVIYAAQHGTHHFFISMPLQFFAPVGAIVLAPMATFFLADIAASFAQNALYSTSYTAATAVYNMV